MKKCPCCGRSIAINIVESRVFSIRINRKEEPKTTELKIQNLIKKIKKYKNL